MAISITEARQLGIIFSGVMPLPPGINQSYKVVCVPVGLRRMVHRIGPTPELEQFKRDAASMLNRSYLDQTSIELIQFVQSARKKVPLAVTLIFYFQTLWKRDVDGGIKAAMDAAFDHIGLNDNLVVEVNTKKRVDAKNPRCEIVVMVADEVTA